MVRRRPRVSKAGLFRPRSLFRGGSEGALIDASVTSSLFQDAAGTTAVTGASDPVGLAQDQSGNGNDASQSTAGSRPLYGIRPRGGIRNFLDDTNDFSGAAWTTGNGASAVSENLISYDGTVNGFCNQAVPITTGETWTFEVDIRLESGTITSNTNARIHIFTAFPATNAYIGDDLTSEWQRFTVTATATSTANGTAQIRVDNDAVQLGVRFPQFEEGATGTAYQERISQYEVTESGQPNVYELVGDGYADYLAGSIPGADYQDGFTLVAAGRLIDGAVSGADEYIASVGNSGSNANFFGILSRDSSGDFRAILGSPTAGIIFVEGPTVDGDSHVWIARFNSSGNVSLWQDGTEYTNTFSVGAITFDKYALNAFGRVSDTIRGKFGNSFTMPIGRALTDTEIQNLGRSLANEVGATWA